MTGPREADRGADVREPYARYGVQDNVRRSRRINHGDAPTNPGSAPSADGD